MIMINSLEQQKLREKFNPDDSILRQHQQKMLDILKRFDKICQENDIKYWLSSGTCLGAIRHHGFIPWDDDADVEMLREDYLKFLKVFKETERYVLQTKDNDTYYVAPYAKLRDKKTYVEEHGQDCNYKYRGIYIDIFALERSYRCVSCFYQRVMWRILMFGSHIKKSSFKRNLFCFYKYIFYKSIAIARIVFRVFPFQKLRHTYGSGFCDNTRYEKEIFPLSYCEFEGYNFPVPRNYDAYLTRIYGDYMKLPDLDKLQNHMLKVEINKGSIE